MKIQLEPKEHVVCLRAFKETIQPTAVESWADAVSVVQKIKALKVNGEAVELELDGGEVKILKRFIESVPWSPEGLVEVLPLHRKLV